MKEWMNNPKEEKELDLWRFLDVLVKRIWAVLLAFVIFGVCGFVYTKLFITPMYRTEFKIYITNRMDEDEEVSSTDKTNTGDLNASIGLMYLYDEIISSRSVLTEAAADAGLNYSYGTLKGMISTVLPEKASMIEVRVVADSPVKAKNLAEALAKRAAERGKEIEERSSMVVLDMPVEPTAPYSPNTARNTLLAAFIGALLTYALFVVIDLVNDRVKDSEDLENRYDLVVVGRIPDMSQGSRDYRYKYKYTYRRYNYGKGYGDSK